MPEIVFISDHTNILTDPSLWWFRGPDHSYAFVNHDDVGRGNKSLDQESESCENLRGERALADQGLPDSLLLVGSSHISENKSLVESVFVSFVTCKLLGAESEAMPQSPWSSVCNTAPSHRNFTEISPLCFTLQVPVVRLCNFGFGPVVALGNWSWTS